MCLQVNGIVERAYNKVATNLMEIVKYHLSGRTEESQKIYNSLLLVFMKIFEPRVSSLQVYSITSTSIWAVSNLQKGLRVHKHVHYVCV